MIRRNFKTLLIHWLWLILIQIVLLTVYCLTAGSWLTIRNNPEKTDAVWVLGGDSCDFHRTRHGVGLYKQGVSDRVLFTGFGEDLRMVLEKAESFGLPRERAAAFDSCLSTLDDAKALRHYVMDQNIRSIVFVTDIYHTRRAKYWVTTSSRE